MKLSEFKDEEALDLLADLIEPAAKIFGSESIRKAVAAKKPQLVLAKIAIKEHKKEVLEILAALNGKTVAEYHCTVTGILAQVLEILNDKELLDFFSSQEQMTEQTSSIFVSENIKEKGK